VRIPHTLLFAMVLVLSGGAQAAPNDAIGSAITVVNLVTAKPESGREERRLSTGDDVRQQELIEVDEESRGEIELRDRTKLALGPGSRLLLDQFVYDPDISGGAIVLNLVKGTFRFITGIAVKPAYVIRTPAASITVRGTIFDVYVLRDDETWLLLIEGAVEVCTQSGKCLVHDQPGKLIRITADDIEKPVKWAKLSPKQDISFDSAFPFIAAPPGIDPEPIFTRDQIVLGTEPEEDKKEDYKKDEKPKAKPKHTDTDDYDGGEPKRRPKKVWRRDDEDYPRETRRHEHGSRGAEIIKKGIKVGIAVGIGIGIAKALGKHRY
jgi:hypothetical protein